LVQDLLIVEIWQEQNFEDRGKTSNLHFSVQSALVAADAVHDTGDVIELMLNLSQQLLVHLTINLVEEVCLLERFITLSVDELEHLPDKHLCQLVVVVVKASLELIIQKNRFKLGHSLDHNGVQKVQVLNPVLVVAYSAQEIGLICGLFAPADEWETIRDVGVDGCMEATHQMVEESFIGTFAIVLIIHHWLLLLTLIDG